MRQTFKVYFAISTVIRKVSGNNYDVRLPTKTTQLGFQLQTADGRGGHGD